MGEVSGWIGDLLKLGEWLRSPKFWLSVFLFCASLLLVPSVWLQRLGLLNLLAQYRPWLAVIGLFAAAILLAELLTVAGKVIHQRYLSWRRHRVSMDYLNNLTAVEKGVLLGYIKNDTETRNFDISDGVVSGLVTKGLLYQSSSVGHLISGFPFNIQPWVRHHLLGRPQLLQGAVNHPSRRESLDSW